MSISIEELLSRSKLLIEVLELWETYSTGRRDSYAEVADRTRADEAALELDRILSKQFPLSEQSS